MDVFWETIRAIVAILFTFSVSIFVHELGHFMFAKLFHVHVETFSIGFGRAFWQRKWGDTNYQIAVIPFGGYVSMSGIVSKELEEEFAKSEADNKAEGKGDSANEKKADAASPDTIDGVMEELNALRSKSWLQRVLIMSAGCINNFITAAVVFFFIGVFGFMAPEKVSPVVDYVVPDVQEIVGLQAGDRILSVDGKLVNDTDEFYDTLLNIFEKDSAATVTVCVKRGETTTSLNFPALLYGKDGLPGGKNAVVAEIEGSPVAGNMRKISKIVYDALDNDKFKFKYGTSFKADGRVENWNKEIPVLATVGNLWFVKGGIDFKAPSYIGGVMPNLSAEKSGLKGGDLITSINGEDVATRREAMKVIRSLPGETVEFSIERHNKKTDEIEDLVLNCEIRPNPDNETIGQIGIVWGMPLSQFTKYSPLKSASYSLTRVYLISKNYLIAVGELFTHSFQTVRENLGGPLMIGVMAKKAADRGWQWFFEMFALFNIILAVTNLLPLPILDGGHIMFSTIESIIRRPLPAKFMAIVFNVFMWLLIALAILLTFNDIIANAWRIK